MKIFRKLYFTVCVCNRNWALSPNQKRINGRLTKIVAALTFLVGPYTFVQVEIHLFFHYIEVEKHQMAFSCIFLTLYSSVIFRITQQSTQMTPPLCCAIVEPFLGMCHFWCSSRFSLANMFLHFEVISPPLALVSA